MPAFERRRWSVRGGAAHALSVLRDEGPRALIERGLSQLGIHRLVVLEQRIERSRASAADALGPALRHLVLGEAQVQPLDVNGTAVGDPVTFTFDSPGPGGKVKLSLSCDDAGCQGNGEAD